MQAKPVSMSAAKKMAKDFAEQHTKGGILSSVLIALFVKLITSFIEQLLQKYDIVPKGEA